MKNRIILLSVILIMGISSYAQQNPMYTQYMFNMLSINPAYAGNKGLLNITALSRIQWVGIEGAPETSVLSVHSPIKEQNMGVGGSIVIDNIGPITQTYLFGDYSYTIQATRNSKLNFGLKAGLSVINGNISSLTSEETNDQLLNSDIKTSMMPNFGLGMLYHSKKGYLGLSIPKLLENEMDKSSVSTTQAKEKRHYFLTGGYVMNIMPDIKFKPTFLTRLTTGAPLSVDVSASFLFNEKMWVGVAHRWNESISGILELYVTEQIRIGYAYDFSTSRLQKYMAGSHEIMVSFDMKFNQDAMRSPRHF